MARYRAVSMLFWTDSKIVDDFLPEEKLFYLYLFTNPHTNLCGCYEISFRQAATEIGLSVEKVEELVETLAKKHDVIRYDKETKEILILKWHKYNWSESAKFRKPLAVEINSIKCTAFHNYLAEIFNGNYTVSIPYQYDSDVTVTVTVTDTVSVTDTDSYTEEEKSKAKEILEYLNQSLGTRYTIKNKETLKHIVSRLREGHTLDDFKTVIYKKIREWKDTEYAKYLRPQTLFGTKFDSYLNQIEVKERGRLDWLDELSDMDPVCENDEVCMDSG